MLRVLAVPVTLLALVASQASQAGVERYRYSIQPLSKPLGAQLTPRFWRPGCPVQLWNLRLLTVSHWGFDDRARTGQLIVRVDVARPLATVFRQLYALRFPIRHMQLQDMYGPASEQPADDDISGAFHCRQSVPSPCTGGTRSGHWSNHAYGYAVDLNPIENPYVGCGMVRDPRTRPYIDRSRVRKGMVTPAVVQAFYSIGWGWGGDWTHGTKDYMHFSINGR
ncbi:MAG TPA: M15 family metallopeptidase [Gaiellaceae bacterium]